MERGGEGGEPLRVTFDFEPDRLDAKGLPNSKFGALSIAYARQSSYDCNKASVFSRCSRIRLCGWCSLFNRLTL